MTWKPNLRATILLFMLTALSLHAQNVYELDFNKTNSLKAIFDLGLRPRNIYGAQREKCEVRNVAFKLLLRNQTVPFDVDRGEFGIDKNDDIYQAELIGPNLKFDAAQQEAKNLFSFFGSLPIGFNEAFDKARTQNSFEPLRELGVRVTSNEPEVRIYFLVGDFVREDLQGDYVRIVTSAYWKSKAQNQRLLRQAPIKPPVGYQNESMEPILSPNQERLIQERKTSTSTARSPASTVKPRSVTATPATSPSPTPVMVTKSARTFPVAAVTILLLLVVAVSAFLATRRKSP